MQVAVPANVDAPFCRIETVVVGGDGDKCSSLQFHCTKSLHWLI